jgi:hypothetical protein
VVRIHVCPGLDSCEHGNEPFGFIQSRKFWDHASNYQLLKKDSAACIHEFILCPIRRWFCQTVCSMFATLRPFLCVRLQMLLLETWLIKSYSSIVVTPSHWGETISVDCFRASTFAKSIPDFFLFFCENYECSIYPMYPAKNVRFSGQFYFSFTSVAYRLFIVSSSGYLRLF